MKNLDKKLDKILDGLRHNVTIHPPNLTEWPYNDCPYHFLTMLPRFRMEELMSQRRYYNFERWAESQAYGKRVLKGFVTHCDDKCLVFSCLLIMAFWDYSPKFKRAIHERNRKK